MEGRGAVAEETFLFDSFAGEAGGGMKMSGVEEQDLFLDVV